MLASKRGSPQKSASCLGEPKRFDSPAAKITTEKPA
tara:strand:- start:48772 stop:48879 length:108 start_codon:yes stop_codon:yes gene_type:complete